MSSAESLRDAIAAARCVEPQGAQFVCSRAATATHPECAEAAALRWIADWLRSDEAAAVMAAATLAQPSPWACVTALADTLTTDSGDTP